jgi:RNA polymerase sigma-70 factor (ECF subfamily)
MESDERLMSRLAGGDEGALAPLLERWRSPLRGFLARRVGDADADDLFQETWLRVVRYRDRYDPQRRFSTWLFQIANNLCRDRGRRREVRVRYRRERQAEAAGDPARTQPPPVDRALDVRRRVAALPEKLREVLVLRYYRDLPEKEIARIVGIPPGTVKSRLHAAVKALREQEHESAAAPGSKESDERA